MLSLFQFFSLIIAAISTIGDVALAHMTEWDRCGRKQPESNEDAMATKAAITCRKTSYLNVSECTAHTINILSTLSQFASGTL